MEEQRMTVRLEELRLSAANPRKRWDEDELRTLGESLQRVGQVQPLVVRRREGEPPYEIVCGERRFRAATLAGMSRLWVQVVDLDDAQVAEVMLAENLARVDLNPVEEARAFQAWLRAQPKAEGERVNRPKELGAKIGRSEDYVRERCKLLRLEAGALEEVEAGRLHLAEALVIAVAEEEYRATLLGDALVGVPAAGLMADLKRWRRDPQQRRMPTPAPQDTRGEAAGGESGEKTQRLVEQHWRAAVAILGWLDQATAAQLRREVMRVLPQPDGGLALRKLAQAAERVRGGPTRRRWLMVLAGALAGSEPWMEDARSGAIAVRKRLKIRVISPPKEKNVATKKCKEG